MGSSVARRNTSPDHSYGTAPYSSAYGGHMRTSIVHTMTYSIPVAIIATCISVGMPTAARANVITDWDEKGIALVGPMPAYPAERMMGMVHCAMFDAVNSIERRYRPYSVELPAEPTTSKEA